MQGTTPKCPLFAPATMTNLSQAYPQRRRTFPLEGRSPSCLRWIDLTQTFSSIIEHAFFVVSICVDDDEHPSPSPLVSLASILRHGNRKVFPSLRQANFSRSEFKMRESSLMCAMTSSISPPRRVRPARSDG
jgi:hypothetical protein